MGAQSREREYSVTRYGNLVNFWARPAGTSCRPSQARPQQIFIFRPAVGPFYKIRIFKALIPRKLRNNFQYYENYND